MSIDVAPIPTSRQFTDRANAEMGGQRPQQRVPAKLIEALDRFHNPTKKDYYCAGALREAIEKCVSDARAHTLLATPAFASLRESTAEHAQIETSFLRPRDMAEIARTAASKGFLLSIRPAGEPTLFQLDQGARPKPHDILEKTISANSLAAAYGPAAGYDLLKTLRAQSPQIEGLVGRWSEPNDRRGTELLGIHFARRDSVTDTEGRPLCQMLTGNGKNQFYLPLDLNDLGRSLAPLTQPHNVNWQRTAYTGDYDLHDLVVIGGSGRPHNVVSDSDEEATALKQLNCGMSGEHKGDSSVPNGVTPYTLFQHGPQVNFMAHMMDKEPGRFRAMRVAESSFPVGVCDRGRWFRAMNIQELTRAYEAVGARVKETWREPAPGELTLQIVPDRRNSAVLVRRASPELTRPLSSRESLETPTRRETWPTDPPKTPRKLSR